MKKFGRNTLAVGLATLLITAAVSFSANGADPVVAQAKANAVKDNLVTILDSKECAATTSSKEDGTPTGNCGDGLSLTGVNAYSQSATATVDGELNGQSTAKASVAPIDVTGLQNLDLTAIPTALENINTGSILDSLAPVGSLLRTTLGPVFDALQDALQGPLDQLGASLPVHLEIGAVNAQCAAAPGTATGDSTVASTDIVIDLGGQEIRIPLTAATSANSDLIAGSPQQLADGILAGLKTSLETSIGGALGPLAGAVGTLQDQLIDPILEAAGPALLKPLSDALAPLVTGTVNKQTATDGAIDVTALHLNVLGGRTLDLAHVACGKNGVANVDDAAAADDVAAVDDAADDSDTVADSEADADADAAADADSAADADVTTTLPNTGASANLLPFWLLGMALVAFGGAVLVNERRRTL